jgi:TetR/AcrR family transcriptional regulator, transcriptional repressor for nem operon
MTKLANAKRQRLIENAARLFHERGLARVSLADIAAASNVPLGNVYYYFKKRDDIALDVLKWRLAQLDAVLARLDKFSTPRQRLLSFISARVAERDELAEHGCANGGLAMQLKRENRKLGKAAEALLDRQLAWTEMQFRYMGQKSTARISALHLVSSLQGMAILAQSLNDPDIVKIESQRLKQWVTSF